MPPVALMHVVPFEHAMSTSWSLGAGKPVKTCLAAQLARFACKREGRGAGLDRLAGALAHVEADPRCPATGEKLQLFAELGVALVADDVFRGQALVAEADQAVAARLVLGELGLLVGHDLDVHLGQVARRASPPVLHRTEVERLLGSASRHLELARAD